ncbi:MAG: hypothetical protein EU540_02890 [Promethearchaeota archaeon]|nr:MAG: hypothetical protein EU540_02890 [Candidatus Lokiarchaeota archaeon]
MFKKARSLVIPIILIILVQQISLISAEEINVKWEYTMRTTFIRNFDMFDYFNATVGYRTRQDIYLDGSEGNEGFYAQSSRIYLNMSVNDDSIVDSLGKIYNYEDCMDFRMNSLIRMLYLDINKSVLSTATRDKICDALGKAKYWHDEPSSDSAIFTTENHQILYHTSELLVGQLFPGDLFTNSDMTGYEKVLHATPYVKQWLNWRGQFGFSEWHSNTYYVEDIAALVNLVDFALDEEIARKAAMVLDLMAFGFAINYFKNRYATSMGRTYDTSHVGTNTRDSVSDAVWIMLGIGEHDTCDPNNMAAVALATSDHYAPPPIFELIAQNSTLNCESKERHNLYLSEGDEYGVDYENDLMYWLGLQAHLAPQTIEATFDHVVDNNRDPMTLFGPQILMDFLKFMAFIKGISLSDYSQTIRGITQGIMLEAANIYTYRTPNYQLSGVQDHMKGMNGAQEMIWQATLDDDAYVFTNSPGGYTHGLNQFFMGGWKPRATLYKNIGVIQYDREVMPFEAELVIFLMNLFTGYKFYNHAYFPRSAFDDVYLSDKWSMGAKDDGYVALYTYEPSTWVSDYELQTRGYKNLYVVELGDKDTYGSFEDFQDAILDITMSVTPLSLGYDISYTSPSQGDVTVSWDDPMYVDGNKIDLGDYKRFDNQYCQQDFYTSRTIIEHEGHYLELNFINSSRYYKAL